MIKLTIEIVNEEFKYSYEVAKSTQSGTHPLTPENFVIFTNMMSMCRNSYINQHEEWMEEIKAKAYLEKHPELLKVEPTQ